MRGEGEGCGRLTSSASLVTVIIHITIDEPRIYFKKD